MLSAGSGTGDKLASRGGEGGYGVFWAADSALTRLTLWGQETNFLIGGLHGRLLLSPHGDAGATERSQGMVRC